MDCKTARTLVDFARPNALELEPRDAEELAGHLDTCPECGASALAERQLDEWLGAAVRQVEVPGNLRANVLACLDAERNKVVRHRFGRIIRRVAVAAALLLTLWGGYRLWQPGPARLDLDRLTNGEGAFWLSPTAERVQDSLRGLRTDAPAPADLRYMYLAAPPALAEFSGTNKKALVPMLVFVAPGAKEFSRDRAYVYLLSAKDFDLKSIPDTYASPGNYHFRTAFVRQDDEHGYLVLHTGESWDWLRAAASETPN
jgi:hypothetical protein